MSDKTFTFEFEYTSDPRKGKPYAAKLYYESDQIQRSFFDLQREWGKKVITVFGTYQAKEGDIIEERHGGSWKNDWRYWFYINEKGEKVQVADINNSREKTQVKKYLMGMIDAKTLLDE